MSMFAGSRNEIGPEYVELRIVLARKIAVLIELLLGHVVEVEASPRATVASVACQGIRTLIHPRQPKRHPRGAMHIIAVSCGLARCAHLLGELQPRVGELLRGPHRTIHLLDEPQPLLVLHLCHVHLVRRLRGAAVALHHAGERVNVAAVALPACVTVP